MVHRQSNTLSHADLDVFLDANDPDVFAIAVAEAIADRCDAPAAFVIESSTGSCTWSRGATRDCEEDGHRLEALIDWSTSSDGVLMHEDLDATDLVSTGVAASAVVGVPVGDHRVVVAVGHLSWDDLMTLERVAAALYTLYLARFVDLDDVSEQIDVPGAYLAVDYNGTTDQIALAASCEGLYAGNGAEGIGLDPYLDLVHEPDRTMAAYGFDRAEETGRIDSVHRLEGGHDHPRWVHLIGAYDPDDGSLVGVAVDLTAVHQSWSNLAKFREFIEQSSDAVYVIDRESARILDVNQTACDMLGYDRSELLEMTVLDINPEFSPDLWDEFIDRVRSEDSVRIEVEHRRKDGTTIPVEIEIAYVRLDREYHIATVRDVSEAHQHKAALTEATQRYHDALDAVPDAVVIVDRTEHTIEDVNQAAVSLFDQSPEALIGTDITAFIPANRSESFTETLADAGVSTGRVFRRYDDGTHLEIVREDGDRLPVSMSCRRSSFGDANRVFITIRDVSDQRAHETLLGALSEASEALMRTYSEAKLADIVVSTASEALPIADVTVYRFDPTDYDLSLLATSDDEIHPVGESLSIEDTAVGQAFTDGETLVLDDPADEGGTAGLSTALAVPVGEYGVIRVGRVLDHRMRQQAAHLLEVLASTAEAAFARNKHERDLRASERELEQKTTSLEQVKELNEQIRQLTPSLLGASSRETVEAALVSSLEMLDAVSFAWVGGIDPIEEAIEPREWTGNLDAYFESASFALDDRPDPPPSVRAVHHGKAVYEPHCGEDIGGTDWRRGALRSSIKSVLSVPVAHSNVTQGVLTVASSEPDAFDEVERAVYEELGALVAHALFSLNRKQALISNQSIEIDFQVADTRCFFLRAAEASGCSFELNGLISQSDGTLVFITVTDGRVDDLLAHLDDTPTVSQYRELSTDGESLVQLRIDQPFIGTRLAEFGLRLRRAEAGAGSCKLTVVFPPTLELEQGVDIVESFFDDATAVAKREQSFVDVTDQQVPDRYLGSLTDRQREAIELAYHRGYFDTPKRATGAEIAEDMDISHSAFHSHLRAAEKHLFNVLFDEQQTLTDTPDHSHP